MRKLWRIGLVLVIGLAACSDKKAEQAAALKQEVQDILGKMAGSGTQKTLTYGDVTVTPDGDAYAVTVDKVAVTVPDEAPIDLGKIGFKLTPDGDDIRKFSNLTLPQALAFKAPDGKEVRATLAVDHINGSWSKSMSQLLNVDALLKNLEVDEPSSGSKLIASDVFYQLQSKDNGQGIFDQEASGGTKLMTVGDKDGQIAIADFKASSNVGSVKLAELMAMRADWQKAAQRDKPADILPLVTKAFKLFKSVKAGISMGQLTVSAGGTTVFAVGGLGFDFGMQDTDQPKVKIGSGLRYAGLSIPTVKDLVGSLGAQILPTDFSLSLAIDDLPLASILEAWGKTLPAANMTDQNAMMGESMMAAGIAVQAIQQAAVKMHISDGKLKAPGLTGSFTGELNNDPKAVLGFTGTANVELSDLDSLIAKAQQFADEPTTGEILGTLQMMRSLSDHATDAAGRPVDRFKITVDAQGTPLVNGKSLEPPGAPPASEQPSSGSDSGTGTGTGTGTTTSP